MKLFFIGGHVTPALAIIDYLLSQKSIHQIYYLGQKYRDYRASEITNEYKLIKTRAINYLPFRSGRASQDGTLRLLIEFYLLFEGLLMSLYYLIKFRPEKIVLFGGFLALPFGIWAKVLGIKIILHEQTILPGKANRFLARLADKVMISFPQTSTFFPRAKVIYTGCPIRQSLMTSQSHGFHIKNDKPAIMIVGASQGSHSLNLAVEKNLKELKKLYNVFHQTGSNSQTKDFQRLSMSADADYHVFEHLSDQEMGYLYQNCKLLVGRSGANTFFEIIHFAIPSVLVPLAISAFGEQEAQAKLLEKHGVSICLDEKDLSNNLLPAIATMISKNHQKLVFPVFPKNDQVLVKIASEIISS